MNLDPNDLKKVLRLNGVRSLHHSNTVATAVNYLRHGMLLSRGRVEQMGLPQTSQQSDAIDKRYGIWNSVFTDSVDIHQRGSKRNAYGPVLLTTSLDVLDNENVTALRVTKKNPTRWIEGEADSERWFMDRRELSTGFVKGRFDQMIVVDSADGGAKIVDSLQSIQLDDPGIVHPVNGSLYDLGFAALTKALAEGPISGVSVKKRTCRAECRCADEYSATKLRFFVGGLFDPNTSG